MKKLFTRQSIPLYAIIAAGLAFRLWHINWGLPELYEEATPLRIGWNFWNWGNPGFDFNPHFFHYPALTFYIQFIAQAINYCIGYLSGAYPDLARFGLTLTPLAVTARIITVLFDVSTITAIYSLGKEIADKRAALIAAFITAINPIHILHAHYVEVDPALTFFSTLALLYIIRIYREPETKWYLLAALFIALAAASKYTGAFLLIVLLGAHLLRYSSLKTALEPRQNIPLLYSLFIAVGGFFLLNPYIAIDYKKFWEDFSAEQFHVAYGHLGVDPSSSTIGYYLLDVVPASFGLLFALVVLASFVHFLTRRRRDDVVFWLYPVLYIAIISTWKMRADRYLLPVLPILALLGSIGLVRFFDWVTAKSNERNLNILRTDVSRRLALILISIVLILQPVFTNETYLRSLGLPDTRALTKRWIENNIPAGSVIATGPYGIVFPDSMYRIFSIPFLAIQTENAAPFYESQWYEDCDLLITSSYDYGRYAQEPLRYAKFLQFYDSLKTRWKPVYEIVPTDAQNGPAFWLYRLQDSLRRQYFETSLFHEMYANPESSRISNFLKDLARLEMEKRKLVKSEQVLDEILRVETDNYRLRNTLAQVLYDEGKYHTALEQLGRSIRSDPNQADVLALAGSALLRIDQPKAAESALQRAILLRPKNEQPYLELIDLYKAQKDKVKLLDILKRYYRILPQGSRKADEIHAMIDQRGKSK